MRKSQPSDDIALQAAQWVVRLTAGSADERERAHQQFAAWQQQSPTHAKAAQALQGVVGQMQQVRAITKGEPGPAKAALNAALDSRKRTRRIKAIAALALACILALPAWVALQHYPPAYLLSDLRTSTGQWQEHVLSDGSRLTLGSASMVDIEFGPRQRLLSLVGGEILVDVASDAQRPFVIKTPEGSIHALGTRFIVDRRPGKTVVSMLESRVEARSASNPEAPDGVVVHAGQRLGITQAGHGPVETIDAAGLENAWNNHLLVVQDQSLPHILDQLDRYRPGRILYDAAQLRDLDVAAVLPLDDTDKALGLLAESIPALRVRKLTPYVVLIDLQPPIR